MTLDYLLRIARIVREGEYLDEHNTWSRLDARERETVRIALKRRGLRPEQDGQAIIAESLR